MYSRTAIENVATILGYTLYPWEYEIIEHMLNNPRSIVQAARQVGKTFCLAFVAALFVLDGKGVIVGMPNMRSAESILFKAVLDNVDTFVKLGLLKYKIDRSTKKIFTNGAQLHALTASKASVKEGYSNIYLVLLDEGQKILDPEVLAIFEPFLTVADLKKEGKLVITGIGGPKEALITICRDRQKPDGTPVFNRKSFPASYIKEFTHDYDDIFDDKYHSLGPLFYGVHYECSDLLVGAHYLFPTISPLLELPEQGRRRIFGIDVGGTSDTSDYTCCVVLETYWDKVNLIDMLRFRNVNAMNEAKLLDEFINKYRRKPGDLAIELNGIGYKLRDILVEKQGMGDLCGVVMNYDKKFGLSNILERLVRDGKFGTNNAEIKKELELMTIEVDNKGKIEWKHSDIFSAILIALSRLGEIEVWH